MATDLMLPAGLQFDATMRWLQGTPREAAAAATDVNGSTDTETVEANPLTFGGATVAQVGICYQAVTPAPLPLPTVTGTPVLTFVVTPALPTGLRYGPSVADVMGRHPDGGRIVGTPTPQWPYTLTVVAAQGHEARLTFALATGAAPPPPPDPETPDRQPTFGATTVEVQRYAVGTAVTLTLPVATGGNALLRHMHTPPDLPDGLTYTPPAATGLTGGTFTGTPTAVHAATTYTLTATDADRDTATLTFPVTVTLGAGHLSPHTSPLSACDSPGAFAAPAGPGGPSSADWGTSGSAGGSDSIPPPSERGVRGRAPRRMAKSGQ